MKEFLYAMFMLAGIFKSTFEFIGVPMPIDLTLLCALFITADTFFYTVRKNRKLSLDVNIQLWPLLFLLLFYAWILISGIYSRSSIYSEIKLFYFLLNILAFVYVLIRQDFKIQLFFRCFILLVAALSLAFLPFHLLISQSKILQQVYTADEIGLISGHYLSLGELSGVSIVFLFASNSKESFGKFWLIFLRILFLIIMVALGARGPLLFAILIIAFLSIFKKYNTHVVLNIKSFLLISIATTSAIVLAVYFWEYLDLLLANSIFRFETLAKSVFDPTTNDISIGGRFEHYRFSLNMIFDNLSSMLFGYGIGSYGIVYDGIDQRLYPHNIILEILFELGFVGLTLFVTWFFSTMRVIIQHKLFNAVFWCILFMLFNLLKSDALIDIRLFFGLISCSLLMGVRNKKARENALISA